MRYQVNSIVGEGVNRRVSRHVMTRVRWLAALALGAAMVAGCSSASSNNGSSKQLTHQTITVLDTQGHHQFLQVWANIPAFEKQTGITVNLVKAATTTDLEQKALQALLLPNSPYDVMTLPDTTTGAAALHMTSLEPYITQSGSTVAAFQAQFPEWVRKADTFGGQVRYASFYAGAVAVVYRKSLFEDPANKAAFQQQFGYALPEPPTTPQQLLDEAKFFTRNGQYGLVFPASGDTGATIFEEIMWRAGLPFTDSNG